MIFWKPYGQTVFQQDDFWIPFMFPVELLDHIQRLLKMMTVQTRENEVGDHQSHILANICDAEPLGTQMLQNELNSPILVQNSS